MGDGIKNNIFPMLDYLPQPNEKYRCRLYSVKNTHVNKFYTISVDKATSTS